ncbi:MAG: type II secretion system protein [Candidatus Gastranaerophilales bacterium]|nr:type II secretion system protein [Candidatus Gastranaerophilales bacterium]
MKKGFTLAETMIVLVVIGVLGAILLPVINKANPDSDLLRFKKAHETLLNAVQELAASDKYYLNGDLGIRADGVLLDGSHEGDEEYFCNTFSQVVKHKKITCKQNYNNAHGGTQTSSMASSQLTMDSVHNYCLHMQNNGAEPILISPDGIEYYYLGQNTPFGVSGEKFSQNAYSQTCEERGVSGCDKRFFKPTVFLNNGNLTFEVKYLCIDIDRWRGGEEPFGYLLTADGKVFPGTRAQEWLQRSVIKK